MARFQYDITSHPAEDFQELVYFCSDHAACTLERVPVRQMAQLKIILDRRGLDGWELVQIAVGKDGLIAFWKKEVDFETAGSGSQDGE